MDQDGYACRSTSAYSSILPGMFGIQTLQVYVCNILALDHKLTSYCPTMTELKSSTIGLLPVNRRHSGSYRWIALAGRARTSRSGWRVMIASQRINIPAISARIQHLWLSRPLDERHCCVRPTQPLYSGSSSSPSKSYCSMARPTWSSLTDRKLSRIRLLLSLWRRQGMS